MPLLRRPLLALFLLGLPALAPAASDPAPAGDAPCADLSARFHDNPRALPIGDLDALRSCIARQQEALRAEQPRAPGPQRMARARLPDES